MNKIEILKYKDIRDVKNIWNLLVKKEDIVVYRNYDWNKLIIKNIKQSPRQILTSNIHFSFYVLLNNNVPRILAPIQIDRKNKLYGILGSKGTAKNLDFIGNGTEFEVGVLTDYILTDNKNSIFYFEDITENAIVYPYLANNYSSTKTMNSYIIKIMDNEEEYLRILSKSTRQNIRTAYNRMNKDDIKYGLSVYSPTNPIDKKIKFRIVDILQDRAQHWIGKRVNKNILRLLYSSIRQININSINQIKETYCFTVSLNEEVAAFMIAYKNKESFLVPKLAIDINYGRYSPGAVLIIESLKWLRENTNVKYLDLSRGDEKYKTTYGGVKYLNHFFKIDSINKSKI